MLKLRWLAVTGAVLILALGCGVGPTPTPKPLLASDLLLRAGEAAGGVSSFEATMEMKAAFEGESFETAAEIALVGRKMAISLDMSGLGMPSGFRSEQIISPPHIYMKIGGLGAAFKDSWYRINQEELFGDAFSYDDIFDSLENPASFLGISEEDLVELGDSLNQAVVVTQLGSGSVDGVAVEKYSYDLDWEAYWEILAEANVEFQGAGIGDIGKDSDELASIEFERFEQWLDESGFPRRMILHMVIDQTGSTEMDVTYHNVNGDVRIEEPTEFIEGLPGS